MADDPVRRPSIHRVLTSRKLAVWLMLAIGSYAFAGTVLPRSVFNSPLFIALTLMLAVCTGVCAWDRTRAALRLHKAWAGGDEAARRRASRNPTLDVPLSPSVSLSGAMNAVARGLGKLRLRTRRDDDLLAGRSGRLGLWGSPVFHWSLVLLFVVVAFGRLSRAEGLIGVPVGSSVADEAAAYGVVDEGPLYPGHSGLTIAVEDLVPEYVYEGVKRHAASTVVVSRDGTELKRQRVFANNPLRVEGLTIYVMEYGLAPTLLVNAPDGRRLGQTTPLVDFDLDEPSGTTPVGFVMSTASGGSLEATLVVPFETTGERVARSLPASPAVTLQFPEEGLTEDLSGERELVPGRPIPLPDGNLISLCGIDYYVRLQVTDDWSVFPIYALLTVGIIGLALAILLPPRLVWVILDEGSGPSHLRVVVRHRLGDRMFRERVGEMVRKMAGSEMPSSDEPAADTEGEA